ncbi:stress response protein NST1-like [Aricia agestis]|uniref:stress response protein NST1-like n=1 Tax=Aricia agestis TaxID=91739 RepID=UPI001C202A33|nr:stress response protein NST1-like [Aricia agestis]
MDNPNFNNFKRNNFTFQNNLHFVPQIPPPPPPPFFNPNYKQISDHEFVKNFESKCETDETTKQSLKASLSKLKEKLLALNEAYSTAKDEVEVLQENINTYSEDQWRQKVGEVEDKKSIIIDKLSDLSSEYLDLSRKIIAKRSAKRLRLKKLNLARKKEKIEMLKEREEKSRLIDENLKKIKDDIQKAKEIEEAKQRADVVLKDVHKKRYEAKKNINKLDALVKLRRARQNTAKGRGESVCENEAAKFQENVEKLKHLWVKKLAMYEEEENELRAQLDVGKKQESSDSSEKDIGNLRKWHQVLFGGTVAPQADFRGDVHKFIRTRCEWDRYISSAGTAIPMDWATPAR